MCCFFLCVCNFKQLSSCATLKHNIYIGAHTTPVDVDHAGHACHCIVHPQCLLMNHDDPPTLATEFSLIFSILYEGGILLMQFPA